MQSSLHQREFSRTVTLASRLIRIIPTSKLLMSNCTQVKRNTEQNCRQKKFILASDFVANSLASCDEEKDQVKCAFISQTKLSENGLKSWVKLKTAWISSRSLARPIARTSRIHSLDTIALLVTIDCLLIRSLLCLWDGCTFWSGLVWSLHEDRIT